jgi:hypothetical protein
MSLLLSQSSHNAIQVIEYAIVECDDMMQCDHMSLGYALGAVLKWFQNFHNVLNGSPLSMSCEDCPVITVNCILEPLAGEISEFVCLLKQHQGRIVMRLDIHNQWYFDAVFSFLNVIELVTTIRCQYYQYSKHSLLYDG